MAGVCNVKDCESKAVSRGLCDKHRKRLARRGTLEASDWGSRTKHPLYVLWNSRSKLNNLCLPWMHDFWAFVRDVGDRPEGDFILRALDSTKPVGPGNFEWFERNPDPDGCAYAKEWRARNPDKVKGYTLKRCYGMSLDEYKAMRDKQGRKCAICGKKSKNLHIDHDHKTNTIRELLCANCNPGLGNFQDNPALLQKAIEYLNKHQGV